MSRSQCLIIIDPQIEVVYLSHFAFDTAGKHVGAMPSPEVSETSLNFILPVPKAQHEKRFGHRTTRIHKYTA